MRPRLSRQVSLVVAAAALLSAVLAGLVSVGLVRTAADTQSRTVLRRETLLVAGLLERQRTALSTRPRQPVGQLLSRAEISLVRVEANGRVGQGGSPPVVPPPTLDAADLRAAAAGQPISATRMLGGSRYLVEGQPVAQGGGVVLLERASVARSAGTPVLRRLAVALLLGVAAALVLGLLLARRIARPLELAAAGARRLAAGERGLQLTPEGPREVAAVTESLTGLAAALSASEARQAAFLVSVSHELRTPLTAVRGFGEALADGVATGGEAVRAGEVITAEADRLQHLVSDLLDLARLGAEDFRLDLVEVDLTALVTDAGEVWRHRGEGQGVGFALAAPAYPVLVRTDARRVRQVLDGLLENALRATPSGRPLVLALDASRPSTVLLEVRDGGPGLTDADLAVAFERSALHDRYRGTRRVGTGVGLALVAGLVARLGGQVLAGHAPEGGASFAVHLPR